MRPEDYERIRQVFHEVSELPDDERERRIREHALPSELEAELRAILEHEAKEQFEEERLGEVGLRLVHIESGTELVDTADGSYPEGFQPDVLPESAGSYRIVRQIGEGGMGMVYEAEQTSPRRRVALKVIRTHLPSQEIVRRFQREAEVLGMLQHPGIAHIYEAVLDPGEKDSPPFIAMELVEGQPLVEYAEASSLTIDERIELIARVCDAVQHAHQRGILHRDLKPGNILVAAPKHESGSTATKETKGSTSLSDSAYGAVGQPKILDFGIARITEGDADVVTLQTAPGQIIGTLAYMSPEQASGESGLLDTRSDVYSIGVILYQLLTGQMPFSMRGKSLPEAIRAIREDAPVPVGSIDKRLRGDIATIIGKAMEKDRERRYSSAAELAADLRRYLRNEPIVARPASGFYHLRKLVRRHRAFAATVALAIVAICVLSVWALFNAERASTREQELSRLSDQRELRVLRKQQQVLWPAIPGRISELEEWLAEADRLIARIPEHEGVLKELGKRGKRFAPSEQGGKASLQFGDDTKTAWWYETLDALIDDLKEFGSDARNGETVGSVRARLVRAKATEKLFQQPETQEAWRRAQRTVLALPAYDGLELPVQPGVIPLGPDPVSGLWEFWHVQSGDRPEQNEKGRWVVGPQTGIVLVLLPGGTFKMGASREPADPNHDPEAIGNEWPPHDVTLAPFYLSKYEMTQGQWDRLMGENPSVKNADPELSWASPVQSVSWTICVEATRRLGLALPTEAQWEYACRAGTDTPWFCRERAALVKVANLADQSFAKRFAPQIPIDSWDDGAPGTAKVGSFDPNALGLHDTHGNVWEWCLDPFYASYEATPARGGDGLRIGPGAEPFRVHRGGSFYVPSSLARSSVRSRLPEDHADLNIGLRPALNFIAPER